METESVVHSCSRERAGGWEGSESLKLRLGHWGDERCGGRGSSLLIIFAGKHGVDLAEERRR